MIKLDACQQLIDGARFVLSLIELILWLARDYGSVIKGNTGPCRGRDGRI